MSHGPDGLRRWRRLDQTTLVSDRWLHLTADRCELAPGQVIAPYYVMHERDWVHVYARNEQQQVLTVTQYRYAADRFCLELPGGVVDDGESPEQAARRELLEETGYTAQHWHAVGRLHANPARQTNWVHVFVADGLAREAEQTLDATEELTCSFHSADEIDQAIADGRFSQALHVASLYRVAQFLRGRGEA